MTSLTRRNFLFGASFLSLSWASGATRLAAQARKPNLVLGVLSDLHITDFDSCEVLRRTLAFFRDRDVDAVVIAGDLTDHGLLCQLENVARSWYEVFPDDCGRGGRRIEKFFVYGNHDCEGLEYRDSDMDRNFAVHGLTREEAARQELRSLGLGKCWEMCFHEPYAPICHKRIKGYDFIGAHWQDWCGQDGVEPWFAGHAGEIDASRPFFFVQHQHPFGTVFAQDIWCPDEGQSVRALAKFPNAVAFTGHSHYPLTDGRCYWQGEFTSIGTSTLSYVCLPDGRTNKPDYRKNLDARQGQVVSVFHDRLEIDRFDFVAMERLDESVVLPLPAHTDSFGVRAVSNRNKPFFPQGAKAEVNQRGEAFEVRFPAAVANREARPFDYKVVLEGVMPDGVKVRRSFLFFHPDVAFSKSRCMAPRDLSFSMPARELNGFPSSFSVKAIARNCYGGVGGNVAEGEYSR